MDASVIFNIPNLIYWLALAATVAVQGWRIGKVGKNCWSENKRWWTGWATVFGSAAPMVIWFGWDAMTVIILAVIAGLFHVIEIDQVFLNDLWKRRENNRWTAQYFLAVLLGLAFTTSNEADFLTLTLVFISLGVCGIAKVGTEGYRESRKARDMRRKRDSIDAQAE
ncbi:MAG: hypothetical protein KDJ52_29330 [Anaerolineae bacterium]|nr:hypothetical protein [Anaerolineae bacterium]